MNESDGMESILSESTSVWERSSSFCTTQQFHQNLHLRFATQKFPNLLPWFYSIILAYVHVSICFVVLF
jgi:hypothetical protein